MHGVMTIVRCWRLVANRCFCSFQRLCPCTRQGAQGVGGVQEVLLAPFVGKPACGPRVAPSQDELRNPPRLSRTALAHTV